MLKKTALIAAAAASAFIALPAAAQAQYRSGGYYDYGRYERSAVRYDQYGRAYTYDRYGNRIYVDNGRYDRYGSYDRYGRPVYSNNSGYYGRSTGAYGYQRCSDGTTGTIVGGAVGALLGSEVARGGSRYGYRRGGDTTTGAIIGGAVGALAGRAIDKNSSRC
ncbi:MAG TPA: glycine zipper 2TM domain-containing protein [Allosphingosinicella sp.]|nr:glycine zipper 2TM domain-containing protein [Allosphingosinicella sp.]